MVPPPFPYLAPFGGVELSITLGVGLITPLPRLRLLAERCLTNAEQFAKVIDAPPKP